MNRDDFSEDKLYILFGDYYRYKKGYFGDWLIGVSTHEQHNLDYTELDMVEEARKGKIVEKHKLENLEQYMYEDEMYTFFSCANTDYFKASKSYTILFVDDVDLSKVLTLQEYKESGPFGEYHKNDIPFFSLPNHNIGNRLAEFLSTHSPCYSYDLMYYYPNVEKDSVDFVWLWLNYKDREKGKSGRVKMKPGKAFRRIYPQISDAELEELVDKFKDQFSPKEYEVCTTESPDIMGAVYGGKRAKEIPFYTTEEHKRLANSCMKYDTDYFDTPVHPGYVYGSGDFIMVYAKEGEAFAGRVLISKVTKKIGPYYAVSQDAIDLMYSKVKELGYNPEGFGSFKGSKILKVECGNRYVGPYFDYDDSVDDMGDYLVVASDGKMGAQETEGCFDYSKVQCEDCGYYVSSDDCVTLDVVNNGLMDMCGSCADEYVRCEYTGEYANHGETTEVQTCYGYTKTCSDESLDRFAIECCITGNWLEPDMVSETPDGPVSKTYLTDNGYVFVENDSMYYHPDDVVELYDEGWTPVVDVELSEYEQGPDGLYYKKEVA